MRTIIYTITEQIKNISILLNPVIPKTTEKVLDLLNIDKTNRNLENINSKNSFDHSKELKELKILFKKILD